MDAHALTMGKHIIADGRQLQLGSAARYPILAHELTHVLQQSGASQGACFPIRRVDFFESIARFFGGGTFSEAELSIYLDGLEGTGHIEDHNDSDNKANAVVEQGMHRSQPLTIRILLIREMLSGHLGGGEQNSILTILTDATPNDRERILEAIGAQELADRFGGEARDHLYQLLGTISRSRRNPVGTEWRLVYGSLGAENLRGADEALNIRSLVAEPTGGDHEPISVVGEEGIRLHGSGAPQRLASDIPHPRDVGGQAYLTFGISGTTLRVPIGRNAAYPAVTRDHHRVTADLQVRFGAEEAGTRTRTTSDETSLDTSRSSGTTETRNDETTTSSSRSRTTGTSDTTEASRSRTHGTTGETEHGSTRGTEDTTSRSVETSVSLRGTLSAELRGDARITAGALISGQLLGTLLALAGPEGIALYEALNLLEALEGTHLTLGTEVGTGFTLHGEVSTEVAMRWQEIRSHTDRAESSDSERHGTSDSEEEAARRARERSESTTTTGERSRTTGTSTSHTDESTRTSGERHGTSVAETERRLIPVVQEATLGFRVE